MTSEGVVAGPNGTRITPAGIEWDAIRIPRFAALQVLKTLKPGSVLVDPRPGEPVLYFFVAPGSTTGWDAPESIALGATANVVLPPQVRQAPPGPYWLVPPAAGGTIQLTATNALHHTLTALQSDLLPLGIDTMRATADELLTQSDDILPRHDDLADMVLRLRGHLTLIISVLEDLAHVLPDEHTARGPALSTAANARVRLTASPGPGLLSATKHARSLARELRALCEQYEVLTTRTEWPV